MHYQKKQEYLVLPLLFVFCWRFLLVAVEIVQPLLNHLEVKHPTQLQDKVQLQLQVQVQVQVLLLKRLRSLSVLQWMEEI